MAPGHEKGCLGLRKKKGRLFADLSEVSLQSSRLYFFTWRSGVPEPALTGNQLCSFYTKLEPFQGKLQLWHQINIYTLTHLFAVSGLEQRVLFTGPPRCLGACGSSEVNKRGFDQPRWTQVTKVCISWHVVKLSACHVCHCLVCVLVLFHFKFQL